MKLTISSLAIINVFYKLKFHGGYKAYLDSNVQLNGVCFGSSWHIIVVL
jgi:hypothetical protein